MVKSILKPGLLIGLCSGFVMSLLCTFDFSDHLEDLAFDGLMKSQVQPLRWPTQIAVIVIDEPSLHQLLPKAGRWPWRREAHAGLVAYLKKAGAKVIVFDILFPEPSEEGAYDDRFAAQIQSADNVWLAARTASPTYPTPSLPIDVLAKASQQRVGYVNSQKMERVARDYSTLPSEGTPSMRSLSATLALHLHVPLPPSDTFRLRWYGRLTDLPVYSASEPTLNGFEILNWGLKNGFELEDPIQAAKLVVSCPVIPKLDLAGKIVFIGSSAAATHDTTSTPLSRSEPGVLIHATALANMINGDYIRSIPFPFRILTILLSSIAVSLICIRIQKVRLQILLTSLCLTSLVATSGYAFQLNYWFPPVLAVISGILTYTCITTYHYIVEGKQKQMYKQLFSDFVSPDVLDELTLKPGAFDLQGDSRLGTVLFCDLVGFTTFTEMATPRQLIQAINCYLSEASQVLLAHGAYVDKFIGDAVMAIFNIPKEQPDHAVQACFAALELPRMIQKLNSQLQQTYPGLKLSLRTGVNTGMMIAGPMGYARKLNYSALGDSVNLASRLEGANKEYSTQIMIGPDTWQLAKDHIEARSLDFLRVKGKTKPVHVYELMAKKGQLIREQVQMRSAYESGFDCYQKRQWAEAIHAFQAALSHIPQDGPSQIYIDRCKHFQIQPPPPDWDGSFGLTTK